MFFISQEFLGVVFISCVLSSLSLLILMLNTIHSLLLLIEIFIFGTFLLFFFNVEFLGLIFLMIYLGAILVLFLFVVMMLDIKVASIQNDDLNSLFFKGIAIWFFLPIFIWWLFSDSLILSGMWQSFQSNDFYWSPSLYTLNFYDLVKTQTNLETVGWFLFDFQPFLFLLSGVILYIAMIGAIVLSVDSYMNANQKIQNPMVQAMRKGVLVNYITSRVPIKHLEMIKKFHWSKELIWWYKKPNHNLWSWVGKNIS